MVRITLSSIGSGISDPLNIWYNDGTWHLLTGATKTQLLAGYLFEPPVGATSYQVRDTGACGAILTLSCAGGTTTTTTEYVGPSTTTTTIVIEPTTTTTTTEYAGPSTTTTTCAPIYYYLYDSTNESSADLACSDTGSVILYSYDPLDNGITLYVTKTDCVLSDSVPGPGAGNYNKLSYGGNDYAVEIDGSGVILSYVLCSLLTTTTTTFVGETTTTTVEPGLTTTTTTETPYLYQLTNVFTDTIPPIEYTTTTTTYHGGVTTTTTGGSPPPASEPLDAPGATSTTTTTHVATSTTSTTYHGGLTTTTTTTAGTSLLCTSNGWLLDNRYPTSGVWSYSIGGTIYAPGRILYDYNGDLFDGGSKLYSTPQGPGVTYGRITSGYFVPLGVCGGVGGTTTTTTHAGTTTTTTIIGTTTTTTAACVLVHPDLYYSASSGTLACASVSSSSYYGNSSSFATATRLYTAGGCAVAASNGYYTDKDVIKQCTSGTLSTVGTCVPTSTTTTTAGTTTTTTHAGTTTTTTTHAITTTTTTFEPYYYSYKNTEYAAYYDACDAGGENISLYSLVPLNVAVVLYTDHACTSHVVGNASFNYYPVLYIYDGNHYAVSINVNGQITSIENCFTTTTTTTVGITTTTTTLCIQVDLGSGSDAPTACANYTSSPNSRKIDTASFATATKLWKTACNSTPADPNYYSDGINWRQWSGAAFVSDGTC